MPRSRTSSTTRSTLKTLGNRMTWLLPLLTNILQIRPAFTHRLAFVRSSSSRVKNRAAFPVTFTNSFLLRNSFHQQTQTTREKIQMTMSTSMTATETTTTTPTTINAEENNHGPVDAVPIRAKIVEGDDSDMLMQCARRLKDGDLVAFPTETVYGLGCNALDPNAIHKVFSAKERPLTDPLIVNVANNDDAYALWEATTMTMAAAGEEVTEPNETHTSLSVNGNETSRQVDASNMEARVLQALTIKFWPGPLTLVAKACQHVPAELMANTGFVACRRPLHAVASALIEQAGVPIAAPSANKFGHVSPTTAQHVWDDLQYEDVWILNGTGCCSVGVESSVAKVELDQSQQQQQQDRVTVTLLRQGVVSLADIQACLQEAGIMNGDDDNKIRLQASTKRATADHVANVAPGQTIRHYSPRIPSYLVSRSLYQDSVVELSADDRSYLSTTVVIDFGGMLLPWRDHVLAYRDLSQEGAPTDAARYLYETLRWAEQVPGADRILFPQFVVASDNDDDNNESDAFALAVIDRLTRAASGVTLEQLR